MSESLVVTSPLDIGPSPVAPTAGGRRRARIEGVVFYGLLAAGFAVPIVAGLIGVLRYG